MPSVPLPDALLGMWRFRPRDNRGALPCYGLDVYPDAERGPGLFADFLWWKAGRLGCATTSSDFVRVPLQAEAVGGVGPVLGGELPSMVQDHGTPVTIDLSRGRADVALAALQGSRRTALEPMEFLPPNDIA